MRIKAVLRQYHGSIARYPFKTVAELCFIQMYVLLREWNIYACYIKLFIDRAV